MDEEQRQFMESLYLEMYNKLIVFASCAFPEEGLAEEAVQETFRIACQRPDQICGSENPKGWLVNTLKYTIRNMRRSRASSQQLLTRYLALQTESITYSVDSVSLEVLYEDMALSEEFKLVKEMAVDGKSHLQMAEARGITVAACKKRMERAKKLLQKKL